MAARGKVGLIWTVLAVLAVAVYVGEQQRSANLHAPVVQNSQRLLPVAIEDIGIVEIMVKATMHRFERDAQGNWFYHGMHDASQAGHEHRSNPQQAETIAKAMVAFGRMQREQQLPLDTANDNYGVTRPDIFIMVYRPNTEAPLARYAIGTVAPDTYSRYLLPVGGAEVVTVPDFHIKNLLHLIDAMKATRPSV